MARCVAPCRRDLAPAAPLALAPPRRPPRTRLPPIWLSSPPCPRCVPPPPPRRPAPAPPPPRPPPAAPHDLVPPPSGYPVPLAHVACQHPGEVLQARIPGVVAV